MKLIDTGRRRRERRTFNDFNNKINKHNRNAAAPHGRLPHTKHKLKIQAWSSLLFPCCHSSFNPSEAPPWDSRPVSGAGVVHYNYSTGLAPFPRLSAPPHSSHTPIAPRRPGGTPETALYFPPPPLPGGARQGGRGVPGGKDR